MKRRNVYPEEHWKLEVDIKWTMGIHCGDMIVLNAQGDFAPDGRVLNPYDLERQTARTIDHCLSLLRSLDAGARDIVNLRVEYVNDGSVDEEAYRRRVADALADAEGATITFIPFRRLVYPDLMVEIDTFAMLSPARTSLPRQVASPAGLPPLARPFAHGLRSGRMIYVGGQVASDESGRVLHPGDIAAQSGVVLDNIGRVLSSFGATHDDVVRLCTFYLGQGTAAEWERGARVRASYFKEPGPAATAITLERLHPPGAVIMIEAWAMLGEDGSRLPRKHAWPSGHWDWPIHMPFKHGVKCADMVFVGGQVALDGSGRVLEAGKIGAQTRTSMDNIRKVLAEFGLGLQDILKLNSFYRVGTVEEFLENLAVRSSYFERPGPAVVGLPVDTLSYKDMMIEIEAIAMGG